MASRRRPRVSTGSVNYNPRLPEVASCRKPPRRVIERKDLAQARASQPHLGGHGGPSATTTEYPKVPNLHVVPDAVDYDSKFGFDQIRAQKVTTRQALLQKMRNSRLPSVLAADLDGDGVIDSTEIRLAVLIRNMDDKHIPVEADRVHAGRRIMARELVEDLDDMEYQRLGARFHTLTREQAVDAIADDPVRLSVWRSGGRERGRGGW
jgi:hypothetical protein